MRPQLTRRAALAAALGSGVLPRIAAAAPGYAAGFNLVQTPAAPFGSAAAARSLAQMRATGAAACAIIPFLWQPGPRDPRIVPGSDMSPDQLRAGIRQARDVGLKVTVKPHVWAPGSWAGAVEMGSEADWKSWFLGYAATIGALADIASAEAADQVCIGTELDLTTRRPEWLELIADIRRRFPGPLSYAAHGAADAETVPFWSKLDAVGATLYPPLGDDRDPAAWRRAMTAEVARLAVVARQADKPIEVLEVGLRSAVGATAKPWESAEERAAAPAEVLQAQVLDLWMQILDRPDMAKVLVWRWFTDPAAGGPNDTDFTVQGKRAARDLARRWR